MSVLHAYAMLFYFEIILGKFSETMKSPMFGTKIVVNTFFFGSNDLMTMASGMIRP